MNPVLFLDFDGVLHPDPCKTHELFQSLPLLAGVLRDFPGLDIVISSAWRKFYGIEALRAYLPEDLRARVVGVTPRIDREMAIFQFPGADYLAEYERQWECEYWLARNRPLAPWLAIDDRDWWFEPGCFNLLLTDQSMGFVPEQADMLRHMIQERLG